MDPVPGRSTNSTSWRWQIWQNGPGGNRYVAQCVQQGATSRCSRAAAQNGVVQGSGVTGASHAGKAVTLRMSGLSKDQRTARQLRGSSRDQRVFTIPDLVDGFSAYLFDGFDDVGHSEDVGLR